MSLSPPPGPASTSSRRQGGHPVAIGTVEEWRLEGDDEPGGARGSPVGVGWRGTHHLVSQQQHRLEAELAGAEVEQVLQAGPQQLHDHDVVVALGPAPLDGRDSHCGPAGRAVRGGPCRPRPASRASSRTHRSAPRPTPAGRPGPALTSSLHHLVELALDVQLGVLRFHTFELDGHFLTRSDVGTCQGWGKQGSGSLSWVGSSKLAPTHVYT